MQTLNAIKVVSVFILLFFLSACAWTGEDKALNEIRINGEEFEVMIADTPAQKNRGLSGTESLPSDRGMLFTYKEAQKPEFWMKDMLIPLDFIWINNGEVVDLHEDVEPAEVQPPNTITPKKKVDMVLEVNAGVIQGYNIKIGDEVVYNK
jgi:hypothetical protein